MRPRIALAPTPDQPAITDATAGPAASTSAGVLTDGAPSTRHALLPSPP